MNTELQARIAAATTEHNRTKKLLARARKNLRILSHAAKEGHPKATIEVLAASAIKVAQLEDMENAARQQVLYPV